VISTTFTASASYRIALLLLGVTAVLALAADVRQGPFVVPSGDLAVIESSTLLALEGRAFLGPYSRYIWHHPGPLYFYLLAPLYQLAGNQTAALIWGAAAINAAALVALVVTALRHSSGSCAIALAGLSTFYVFRIANSLATAWNPHVLALPTLALVVMSAALATGRVTLLPWLAMVASFLVQTHVSTTPTALAVALAAAGMMLMRVLRNKDDSVRRTLRRQVGVATVLTLAAWLLPLVEQATTVPGNLSSVWSYFTMNRQPALPLGVAFVTWADLLAAPFSPALEVASSGGFNPGGHTWSGWLALSQVGLVSVATIRAARSRDPFRAALGALLLVAVLVSLWSITRMVEGVVLHAVFWMTGLGALNVAFVLDGAVATIGREPTFSRRAAAAVCVALCVLAMVRTAQQVRRATSRLGRPAAEDLTTLRLWQQLDAARQSHTIPKPLIRIQQETWPVAAGIIVQLQKARVPFTVEPAWLPMFSNAMAPRGDEEAVLWFARPNTVPEFTSKPGSVLIGERDGIFLVLDSTARH
jgi:hypothetical protein